MGKFIDRAELFNQLATVKSLEEAYAVIQGMPEADAVEVIRCKNCNHYDQERHECHNPIWGLGWGSYPLPYTYNSDFCSMAERSEDG